MTQKYEFPAVWDSSMLAALRSCPQKFYLEYVANWKPKVVSHHLKAGGAFAAGLEMTRLSYYVQHESADKALESGIAEVLANFGDYVPPDDSPKNPARMAGALEFYFDKWKLGSDPATPAKIGDRYGIEFSFAEPLSVTHPVSGEPLIYCGRADQICDYAGGLYVQDDKTASQLGATWSRQWDLRSQFTGYCWAAKKVGIPVQGTLVRGISILKTKYDCAEAITYRPDWQIERWHSQVLKDIERAKQAWVDNYWDFNLDHACAEYGGCPFRQICLIQDATPFLEVNFERRYWNPITREETVLG